MVVIGAMRKHPVASTIALPLLWYISVVAALWADEKFGRGIYELAGFAGMTVFIYYVSQWAAESVREVEGTTLSARIKRASPEIVMFICVAIVFVMLLFANQQR